MLKLTKESVVELIYPRRCPGCDELLYREEKRESFCRKCKKQIIYVSGGCMKCGKPLADQEIEYCGDCRKKHKSFIQGKAIYRYSGPMKNAMYKFKYYNRRCYGRVFAREAYRYYGKWIEQMGIDLIVPVPMYNKKKRKRGYNQAEVFARELSRVTGIPVDTRSLIRVRSTKAMKGLNDVERKYNLQNAFKLSENGVKFRKVLVIDDIYTTGTTADNVAKVLLDGQAKAIYCMSICIGG